MTWQHHNSWGSHIIDLSWHFSMMTEVLIDMSAFCHPSGSLSVNRLNLRIYVRLNDMSKLWRTKSTQWIFYKWSKCKFCLIFSTDRLLRQEFVIVTRTLKKVNSKATTRWSSFYLLQWKHMIVVLKLGCYDIFIPNCCASRGSRLVQRKVSSLNAGWTSKTISWCNSSRLRQAANRNTVFILRKHCCQRLVVCAIPRKSLLKSWWHIGVTLR